MNQSSIMQGCPDLQQLSQGAICDGMALTVLDAHGPEAADFLHKQLTQDVLHLQADEVRYAGYCNNKGRLQAIMLVWRAGPEHIRLLCPAQLAPGLHKRLSMFILRAKVKLSISDLQVLRLCGAGSDGASGIAPLRHAQAHNLCVLRLPDSCGIARHLWLAPRESTLPASLPQQPAAGGDWLDVRSGMAWITEATFEAFVPQMVNLEVLGGVNFKKGCYPGQEVVARSQYLGKLKRRMFLAHSALDALPAGVEVFGAEDPEQACGQLVLSAPAPEGGVDCLIELKTAFSGDQLSAGGAALRLLELPYQIPVQE
ncbi:folate-binding protein [Massilia sp. W12]|uniref:CAF17-like 4Fe-4S cluster assembly/insertion protein YgfZ n=1 Tax=Massilia sp. W12 TaxID=3126507 RepID=UPI0030D0D11A